MLKRYLELAELPEAEIKQRLQAMATAEYSLPEGKLRPFTLSRMRMFLSLPPATAKKMAAAYDGVMLSMPGNAAMKRVSLVQTLVQEFSPEEEATLRDLNPNLFGSAPSRAAAQQARTDAREAASVETAQRASRQAEKKGWWPFARK
jgi:hypothetical protein